MMTAKFKYLISKSKISKFFIMHRINYDDFFFCSSNNAFIGKHSRVNSNAGGRYFQNGQTTN